MGYLGAEYLEVKPSLVMFMTDGACGHRAQPTHARTYVRTYMCMHTHMHMHTHTHTHRHTRTREFICELFPENATVEGSTIKLDKVRGLFARMCH